MKGSDITRTAEDSQCFSHRHPVPVLMVAHAPPDTLIKDRCRLFDNFTVGRNPDSSLILQDTKVSSHHLNVSIENNQFFIADLGSTNGTYLDGTRIINKTPLHSHAVIRIGRTILVFNDDGEDALAPTPATSHGMIGRFHIASILRDVEEAAFSKEHLLITGPTGSGKELAAKAIHTIMTQGRSAIPYVTHNAACFTNDDEATSTLFGIADRVFTSVNKRSGLIEQAEGGVLFLDEIHNYSTRVQRSLLRLIEDKKYSRIGETTPREATVRFIFASNEPHAIAPDLLGRLRQSLSMTPLTERRADIPSIFDYILERKLKDYSIANQSARSFLKAKHYELMCRSGFEKYNVRGIKQIADIIATKIATGTSLEETIDRVFSEQFTKISSENSPPPHSPMLSPYDSSHDNDAETKRSGSKYENYKKSIIEIFNDRDGNISSTERALKRRGFKCSRRHLTHYLKKWKLI